MGLAAIMWAAACEGVVMDPINGTWRDDFKDLAGLEENNQGGLMYPSGYTVDSSAITWSQPYGKTGMSAPFSAAGAIYDPTVEIANPGSISEQITLWSARYDPKGAMEFAEEYFKLKENEPEIINNGLFYPEEIKMVPFEGSNRLPVVGWGTFFGPLPEQIQGPCTDLPCSVTATGVGPLGTDCRAICLVCACEQHINSTPEQGAPRTDAIGSWLNEPIYFGPKAPSFVSGFGYSATFLVVADLGETHYSHSTIPYVGFEFWDEVSKKSYRSTTLYEADFVVKQAIFADRQPPPTGSSLQFEQFTPVTVSFDSLPDVAGAEWAVRSFSLVGPRIGASLAGHNHCTAMGPVFVTANRGSYFSTELDTLSDMTEWLDIGWDLHQTTGYADSQAGCSFVEPRTNIPYRDSVVSVMPCGSPLTPVRLTYRVRPSASSWTSRTVPHGGETVDGFIGLNLVNLSSTPLVSDAGIRLAGRYFRYELTLFNRSAASELDPDLAPANEINSYSGQPFPDYIYFSGLRPVVRRISVRYKACAARAVSRVVAPTGVKKWGRVDYTAEHPNARTSLSVDVLAADGSVLVSGVKPGESLAERIDPFVHPSIKLAALLHGDPTDCSKRPVLLSWGVAWEPMVDLIELGRNGIRPDLGESCPIQVQVSQPGPIRIGVYDMAGQLVTTLLDGEIPPQALVIEWNGRNEHGATVAPGVYFITAKASDGKRKVKRLAVIR